MSTFGLSETGESSTFIPTHLMGEKKLPVRYEAGSRFVDAAGNKHRCNKPGNQVSKLPSMRVVFDKPAKAAETPVEAGEGMERIAFPLSIIGIVARAADIHGNGYAADFQGNVAMRSAPNQVTLHVNIGKMSQGLGQHHYIIDCPETLTLEVKRA